QSLFPNLRHLACDCASIESMRLLYLPFPSLTSLDVKFDNPRSVLGFRIL
ncbi:hypothetical protein EV363DRAFT_1157023, partial [Boletus edulis]